MLSVTALYKFTPINSSRLEPLKADILAFCEREDIRGLMLLSIEGVNATMAGPAEGIQKLKDFLQSSTELGQILFKDSESHFQPFKRLKVDIREEIVTLRRPDIVPQSTRNNHLSPEEWHRVLTTESDYVLIDTRNDYEVEIGKFKGAVDPEIRLFSEFADYVKKADIPKEKKVLMYCTGGIRCEKALVFMQNEGYDNVFQLEGGILNYLQQYPEGEYEGECFIFDHRVALNAELKPTTQYSLCPHCGNPGKESLQCTVCEADTVVCHRCREIPKRNTCSKNCEHHAERRLNSVKTGRGSFEAPQI